MSKAFTTESEAEDDPPEEVGALPPGGKNYMTPQGFRQMREELGRLLRTERPKVVETVSWAASNGDRSENGDYIYGKRRLREIDLRIPFLSKPLETAWGCAPPQHQPPDHLFFPPPLPYPTSLDTNLFCTTP